MPIIPLDRIQQFAAINLLLDPGHIGGPVVVPQCAQIVLNWSLGDGKTAHNVMYGRYSGAFSGSPTQADAIKSAITSGANWTALALFLGTSGSLASVSIRNVSVANQAIVQSVGAATPGTSASPSVPDEVAIVVTLRTAFTGPSNRGRIFIPNWANNAVGAGNVVAAGAVTALGNWANTTLLGAFTGQGYTPVIGQLARAAYTGTSGTQHPARAASSVTITSAVVRDNHFDTIRRRGLK